MHYEIINLNKKEFFVYVCVCESMCKYAVRALKGSAIAFVIIGSSACMIDSSVNSRTDMYVNYNSII